MTLSEIAPWSNSTRALLVAKLTLALTTPGSLFSVRSLRAAQEAQCMPPMANVVIAVAVIIFSFFFLAPTRLIRDGEA
jgi:hypothetical protein